MAEIAVLAQDWGSAIDPVPYYSDNPNGCLDFSSIRVKPRSRLTRDRVENMPDCETGAQYEVVICRVSP